MTLAALIRGARAADSGKSATATPATPATLEGVQGRTVATVATVAVANPQKLAADTLPDPAAEDRRQRVLGLLAERPGIRYAVVVDNPDTDPVILALAIRGAMQDGGTVTCELHIPREKYDPFLLLDLIERHGATVH